MLFGTLGIGLAAACAATINHVLDRRIAHLVGGAQWVHDQASLELMSGAQSPDRLRAGWVDTRRRVNDLAAPAAEAAVLDIVNATGGWPLAVHLAVEAARRGEPLDRETLIEHLLSPDAILFEYLAEDVRAKLSRPALDALVKDRIIERLDHQHLARGDRLIPVALRLGAEDQVAGLSLTSAARVLLGEQPGLHDAQCRPAVVVPGHAGSCRQAARHQGQAVEGDDPAEPHGDVVDLEECHGAFPLNGCPGAPTGVGGGARPKVPAVRTAGKDGHPQ